MAIGGGEGILEGMCGETELGIPTCKTRPSNTTTKNRQKDTRQRIDKKIPLTSPRGPQRAQRHHSSRRGLLGPTIRPRRCQQTRRGLRFGPHHHSFWRVVRLPYEYVVALRGRKTDDRGLKIRRMRQCKAPSICSYYAASQSDTRERKGVE